MPKTARGRYLTKSRYKLAVECPTKLFYTGKAAVYADKSLDDPFLKALARGGFQVGALAKCYFPGGIEVEAVEHEAAVLETERLLRENTDVTIFEAALRHEGLFVRVDILVKTGSRLQLIEVKSKSFDPEDETPFYDKTALKKSVFKLTAEFAPYLYDVAFQTHVCRQAMPGFSVTPYLMLTNKASVTSVDGLNQLFLLQTAANGRSRVVTKPGLTRDDVGSEILCQVDVSEAVQVILSGRNAERGPAERCQGLPFADEVKLFADAYAQDRRLSSRPGSRCKHCEFRAQPAPEQKSGFDECWLSVMRTTPAELREPFVFDIWNIRSAQKLLEDGKTFVKQLAKEDLAPKAAKDGESGLSQSQRQWLQAELVQTGATSPYADTQALAVDFASWRFPLHFIDFETTMVAIPFTKGRRPYEQVAFQFSHHVVHADGRIEHAHQYLNAVPGFFPNFAFVRALKAALDTDQGTIFRYAAHENTVLCQIHDQLAKSSEPDAAALMAWIRTVTTSSFKHPEPWSGDRSMVDLCDLVKRYYYHPATKGSNSIKSVLPAVLGDSEFLQQKYGQPVYGSLALKSLNFQAVAWVERHKDGSIKDPYKMLPSVYQGLDRDQLDLIVGEDELADGGAAMIAYAMMQFTQMSGEERQALEAALLRYCELDTLAMVMLYEYWRELIQASRKGRPAA